MLVKLWCVLHNISIRSNTSKFHDTFVVDLKGNGNGLKIAQILNPSSRLDLKAQFSNARCTFSVGSYTGGQLTFQTSATWPSDLEINIFSQSYVLSTTRTPTLMEHTGLLFNIVSLRKYPKDDPKVLLKEMSAQANLIATNSVIIQNDSHLQYYDTKFLLESKHLSRSSCLGHLEGHSMIKGYKVYSTERPCGTFTSHANILIKDTRYNKKSGIRLLTFNEICRLDFHSPAQIDFFTDLAHEFGEHLAYKYIANCIPPGMLYVIYSTLIQDLISCKAESNSGGELNPGGAFPSQSTLAKPRKFYSMCQYLMACLFKPLKDDRNGAPAPTLYLDIQDIDIVKKRAVPNAPKPKKVKQRPTQSLNAKRRWSQFHKIHHCPSDVAQKTMKCTVGHGLHPGDIHQDYLCVDCTITQKDKQPRRHFNPVNTELELELLPGEGWSLDGADLGHLSYKKGYRYAINFVCMKSKLRCAYFTKSTNSFEFKEALEWLMAYTNQFTGRNIKILYSDMFSSYMEFNSPESIADFRKQYGISLRVIPPYMHHMNHEAEHSIDKCTKGCRTRLRHLVRESIRGTRIDDPLSYWPYAWQHYIQSFNMLANVTLEKRWGSIMTPWQLFTSNFKAQRMNLHLW